MHGYLPTSDLAHFLMEMPRKILLQVQNPVLLIQLGGIALAGLLAWWLSRLVRAPLTRFAVRHLPRNWGPGFLRATQSIAMPVLWLAPLWLGSAAGAGSGIPLPLVDAAIGLLLAWICIRLLSFTVSSAFVSSAIALVAWSVAALNILGLYRPFLNWMGRIDINYSKQHHITLLDLVDALILLIVLLWLTRLTYRFLQRRIEQSPSLTPSLQVLFTQLLQIFLPAIAVIVALQTVGVDLTTLTVTFGALGLGIGLGLQRIVANLVAGLSLLMGNTIKPGDIIEYKNAYGWVTAMGAR